MTARPYFRDAEGAWRVTRLVDDTPSVDRLLDRLEADVAAGKVPPGPRALRALVETARREDGGPSDGLRRRLHALARQCGLDRDDRLEVAEVLLRRDVGSWNDLDEAECRRLADAMEGFAFIAHLQARAGARWRYDREQIEAAGTDRPREGTR